MSCLLGVFGVGLLFYGGFTLNEVDVALGAICIYLSSKD